MAASLGAAEVMLKVGKRKVDRRDDEGGPRKGGGLGDDTAS